MTTKQCSKCNETRDLSFFSKDSRNKDGLQSQCQICRKAHKQLIANSRRGEVKVADKCCNKCNITKPADAFYRDAGISDGLATICKDCRAPKMQEWREENRERYNANMRKMRAEQKERFKDIDLKRTYGISLKDYNQMLKSQGGLCMICQKTAQGKRPLVVDHNHETGKVRGLLCYGCNRALHVLETKDLLTKAISYLEKHKD